MLLNGSAITNLISLQINTHFNQLVDTLRKIFLVLYSHCTRFIQVSLIGNFPRIGMHCIMRFGVHMSLPVTLTGTYVDYTVSAGGIGCGSYTAFLPSKVVFFANRK